MRNLPTMSTLATLALIAVTGCADDGHDHDHENEVITTVRLTFTPTAGGTPSSFEFDDPDGDGGAAPTIDNIDLAAGDYSLTLSFENGLEGPPEDITEEIKDEEDEHQVFLTGTAVTGPAADNPGAALTHAYDDQDADGLPIGLTNTVTAVAGSGDLTVTLRHMPRVTGGAVKVDGLADIVKNTGFSGIGGSSDVQVTFPVTVQ